MPDASTNRLNHSISQEGMNSVPVIDTLSVRLTGVDPEATVEIDGISWGMVRGAAEGDITDFDFGALFVLRNEVFDVAFNYSNANVHAQNKDVVFEDVIIREHKYRDRYFKHPIKLTGFANYLIVMNAPFKNGVPADSYTGVLTVKGRLVNRCLRHSLPY